MNEICMENLNPSDYSENVNYQKKEYPIYFYKGILSHYPDFSAVSHWHEDLEFTVILSGHMTYNVSGNLIEIEEGNGILVNSRQFHYGFSLEHTECEFVCILFHPLLLRVNDYFEKRYVSPVITNTEQPYLLLSRQVSWQKQILCLLKEIYRCGDGEFDILKIQQLLFSLWVPLYEHFPKIQNANPKPDRQLMIVKKMVAFIQSHYREALSLDMIAASGNVSRSSCSALFHKYLSQSPITYLTGYRLNQSLHLLLHTDLSIMEIGFEVGFGNASYFSETFKKYFHCTPREYVKSQHINK